MMRPKNFMAMSEKKCVKLKGGGNEEGRRCLVDADELGRRKSSAPRVAFIPQKIQPSRSA